MSIPSLCQHIKDLDTSVKEVCCPKKISSKSKSLKEGSSKESIPVLNSLPLSNPNPLYSTHPFIQIPQLDAQTTPTGNITPPDPSVHPLPSLWNSASYAGLVFTELWPLLSCGLRKGWQSQLHSWRREANIGVSILVQSPSKWKICLPTLQVRFRRK